ncbi:hypothetical protein BHD05_12035 [Marisediminicola antarctica]|uniref:Uncharacterized protein n=1 Tax=Marisediminicola antarctica TaxID=674079 RepID=A0A7L5ALR8_9MICO|nr:hypothetical protein [Marisediminicola antarctica]QHO70264.1 hypothetical protein BHD05_12035 [Marisediminicola antarctica]
MPIVEVCVADLRVAEQPAPERHDLRSDECVDGQIDVVHGGRVSRNVEFAGDLGDLAREVGVASAEPAEFVRDQSHHDVVVAQVDVGVMVRSIRQSSTPVPSWNCLGVICSTMRPTQTRGRRARQG